jgi:hypothetical protein
MLLRNIGHDFTIQPGIERGNAAAQPWRPCLAAESAELTNNRESYFGGAEQGHADYPCVVGRELTVAATA